MLLRSISGCDSLCAGDTERTLSYSVLQKENLLIEKANRSRDRQAKRDFSRRRSAAERGVTPSRLRWTLSLLLGVCIVDFLHAKFFRSYWRVHTSEDAGARRERVEHFLSHFRIGTPVARPVRKAKGLTETAVLPKKLHRRMSRTSY